MIVYETKLRVRYGETDQMGYCYHGNYAQYFEIGRVEWLRNVGVSYKEIEANGIILPVVKLQIHYKKPATYDDRLTIKTIFKKRYSRGIEFDYEIFNEKNEMLSTANTMLLFVDMKSKRVTKCPEILLDKLRNLQVN